MTKKLLRSIFSHMFVAAGVIPPQILVRQGVSLNEVSDAYRVGQILRCVVLVRHRNQQPAPGGDEIATPHQADTILLASLIGDVAAGPALATELDDEVRRLLPAAVSSKKTDGDDADTGVRTVSGMCLTFFNLLAVITILVLLCRY